MGEKKACIDVAKQNIEAMSGNYDYIVTLCASCASHLSHNYPFLLGENDTAAKAFSDKVIPFSAFMTDVLGVTADKFKQTQERATMHAPCHLCRGMGVVEQPRKLLALGGYEYAQADLEQVCCGFGGTYSAKFPGVSERILKHRLMTPAAPARKCWSLNAPAASCSCAEAPKRTNPALPCGTSPKCSPTISNNQGGPVNPTRIFLSLRTGSLSLRGSRFFTQALPVPNTDRRVLVRSVRTKTTSSSSTEM